MKKIFYLLMIAVGFISCDPTVEEPEPDIDKLFGTWTLGNTGYVSRDGVDITKDFVGLSITFQDGKIDVVKGGFLFPLAQDVWTYTTLDKKRIQRISDNLEMDLDLTDDTLFLRFTYKYTVVVPTGRSNNITGKYEIKLQKTP